MQPMGRKKIRQNLVDNHLRDGGKRVENWWEDEILPCKKTERQRSKAEIRKGNYE